jgi:hypothetical protein
MISNSDKERAMKSPSVPVWHCTIMFNIQVTPGGPYERTDICQFLGNGTNDTYRFDPNDFPFTAEGKAKLQRELEFEAMTSSGLKLLSPSGKKLQGKDGITFDFSLICSCAKVYETSGERNDDGSRAYKSRIDSETKEVINQDVRSVSYHNDRRNDRPEADGG